MPSLFERALARVALAHAGRGYRRFERLLRDSAAAQSQTLQRALACVAGSEQSRQFGLDTVRTVDEFRRAVPLQTFEDIRPRVERVMAGEVGALFAPGTRVLMFATTSGTTNRQKYIPVTQCFADTYRRGWNVFGLKMLTDHPRAILRGILQSSGRYDESFAPSGVPCGAITGLMARFQKGIVRKFYVGPPELAYIDNPQGRYYALARLGVVRDVAFAITANPSTLIRIAETANQQSEALLRDVHDGTIDAQFVPEARVRTALRGLLKPDPARARILQQMRRSAGRLAPRDYWKLEFLACWTGGSMQHYLPQVRRWFGEVPIRDIGLLASEGRVSIPIEDDRPVGVLDLESSFFEFQPVGGVSTGIQNTYLSNELLTGHEYSVVISNMSGILRYKLDDVIAVRGNVGTTPVVEFLYRGGGVSSVAGEKLTENQVSCALAECSKSLELCYLSASVCPVLAETPYYRITCQIAENSEQALTIATLLDRALCRQNPEYDSRRKSFRIGPLQHRFAPESAFTAMDARLQSRRRGSAEQYKRPHLFVRPGQDDEELGIVSNEFQT